MSDTSIGASLGSARGAASIDLRAELSAVRARNSDSTGCPPPAGWWIAVVVLGGTAGWVGLLTAMVT